MSKRKKPLTKRTWVKTFKNYEGDTAYLVGYGDCIDREAPVLEKMAKTAKDLDDLKQKLLDFVQTQRELSKDIDKKWASPNCEKYGFPKDDYNLW